MKSNYKRIGAYIQLVDNRNIGLKVTTLLGLTITKEFIPSVANTVGTDMANYKIIKKGQFACSLMQVRRDKKIPVALQKDYEEAVISQAYPVFEVIDTDLLLPGYLMMWMSRSEFDREACFYAVGGVRGSLEWEDFCNMELPVPDIEKQKTIVKEYNTIANRIKLNEQLNQKLEETAQAIYKQWFMDFEFPINSPPLEGWQAKPDGVVHSKRNTKAYHALPYNSKLKERAKALRKAGVLSEVLFWQQVHKKKFKGLDFDRQKIIGNYIVDFYCPNHNVVIEIDGCSHDDKQEYDAEREAYLKGLGLTVIHIKDIDVKKRLSEVMAGLGEHPVFQVRSDHPVLRTPLQRRGIGYKSSGGKMVWNEELGKEIPRGWSVETLGNTIESYSKKHDFEKENLIFFNTSDILNGELLHNNYSLVAKMPGQAKKSIQKYDILYSEIRPKNRRFALVRINADDYVVSTKLMVLRKKVDFVSVYRIYHFLTEETFVSEINKSAEGRSGTFPQITFEEDLEYKPLILADDNNERKWNNFLIPFYTQLFVKKDEIRSLMKMKDILLSQISKG